MIVCFKLAYMVAIKQITTTCSGCQEKSTHNAQYAVSINIPPQHIVACQEGEYTKAQMLIGVRVRGKSGLKGVKERNDA